jgi:hypothetical protein
MVGVPNYVGDCGQGWQKDMWIGHSRNCNIEGQYYKTPFGKFEIFFPSSKSEVSFPKSLNYNHANYSYCYYYHFLYMGACLPNKSQLLHLCLGQNLTSCVSFHHYALQVYNMPQFCLNRFGHGWASVPVGSTSEDPINHMTTYPEKSLY